MGDGVIRTLGRRLIGAPLRNLIQPSLGSRCYHQYIEHLEHLEVLNILMIVYSSVSDRLQSDEQQSKTRLGSAGRPFDTGIRQLQPSSCKLFKNCWSSFCACGPRDAVQYPN